MVPVAPAAADEVPADGVDEPDGVDPPELHAARVAPAPTAREPDRNVRRDSAEENKSDTT